MVKMVERRDLNPRPSRPERDALPAALRLERGKYSFFRKWSNMWSDQFFTGFLKNWNAEKVNVFKGFRRFRKFCRRERRLTPERCALPAALRLVTDFVFRNPQTLFFHSFNKRKYYNKYERKSQSFSHRKTKNSFLFLFICFRPNPTTVFRAGGKICGYKQKIFTCPVIALHNGACYFV